MVIIEDRLVRRCDPPCVVKPRPTSVHDECAGVGERTATRDREDAEVMYHLVVDF